MPRRSFQSGIIAALLLICLLAVYHTAQSAVAPAWEWSMTGRDVANSRTQPFASQISVSSAPRLAVKWTLTTSGDVSATPAAVGGYGSEPDAVYFPDWGGKLWKVNAASGSVIWVRTVSEYNGIAGSLSRTSPVVTAQSVFIGDLNGNIIAVDPATGDRQWIVRPDPHPAAIFTTSPIYLKGRLYVATSSNESRLPPACCTFRGSITALDAATGQKIWQSFVLPDFGGPGGFAGGAFVNPPAIDEKNGLLFAAAGQTYTVPANVAACLAAAPTRWNNACFPSDAHFNSIVAFDLASGAIKWSFKGAGDEAHQLACGGLPRSVTWCPGPAAGEAWPAAAFSTWDFAGSGANVFTATIDGKKRDLVGVGQKSGVYWTLDAKTGDYVWSTLVGPGSDPGGIQWGTAYDGKRIYAAIGHNTREVYQLAGGGIASGGSWAALDPSTGAILWQTADPQSAPDLASLTVGYGVLYAGSLAASGNQMYALNASSGAILWQFPAGGSVVGGPAVVSNSVFWGSGYARTGGVGNNKFYAFTVGGK